MIDSFREKYRFLSNFYPVWVVYEGIAYPSSEHAYQAAKSLDVDIRRQISVMEKPGQTKRFGASLQKREDWDDVKASVMLDIVRIKFKNPVLAKQLIGTGDEELIEGNHWHDNFWGICKCEKCASSGMNMLGKILMQVRTELKTI
jgi:ribA/ribD-fused uncharacterized protein